MAANSASGAMPLKNDIQHVLISSYGMGGLRLTAYAFVDIATSLEVTVQRVTRLAYAVTVSLSVASNNSVVLLGESGKASVRPCSSGVRCLSASLDVVALGVSMCTMCAIGDPDWWADSSSSSSLKFVRSVLDFPVDRAFISRHHFEQCSFSRPFHETMPHPAVHMNPSLGFACRVAHRLPQYSNCG